MKDKIATILRESDCALTFSEIIAELGQKTSKKPITENSVERALGKLVVLEGSVSRITIEELNERLGILKCSFRPHTRLFFLRWKEETQIENWVKENLSQEELACHS